MKLQKVQKKQMKGTSGPQLYACTVEFTEDELASFIDNVVVETSPGVAEDLTSFVLTKTMGIKSPLGFTTSTYGSAPKVTPYTKERGSFWEDEVFKVTTA